MRGECFVSPSNALSLSQCRDSLKVVRFKIAADKNRITNFMCTGYSTTELCVCVSVSVSVCVCECVSVCECGCVGFGFTLQSIAVS